MLISEYLALRNQISVTTGNTVVQPANGTAKDAVQGGSFAEALQEKLNETLERLNKGVELAAGKGSSETLVLEGRNAFVVSVKNNKVITTLSDNELNGNVFTNIDSTVIV